MATPESRRPRKARSLSSHSRCVPCTCESCVTYENLSSLGIDLFFRNRLIASIFAIREKDFSPNTILLWTRCPPQASVNPKAETCNDLQRRRKKLHVGMCKLLRDDLSLLAKNKEQQIQAKLRSETQDALQSFAPGSGDDWEQKYPHLAKAVRPESFRTCTARTLQGLLISVFDFLWQIKAECLLETFKQVTVNHEAMDKEEFNDDHKYKSCMNEVCTFCLGNNRAALRSFLGDEHFPFSRTCDPVRHFRFWTLKLACPWSKKQLSQCCKFVGVRKPCIDTCSSDWKVYFCQQFWGKQGSSRCFWGRACLWFFGYGKPERLWLAWSVLKDWRVHQEGNNNYSDGDPSVWGTSDHGVNFFSKIRNAVL